MTGRVVSQLSNLAVPFFDWLTPPLRFLRLVCTNPSYGMNIVKFITVSRLIIDEEGTYQLLHFLLSVSSSSNHYTQYESLLFIINIAKSIVVNKCLTNVGERNHPLLLCLLSASLSKLLTHNTNTLPQWRRQL